MTTNELRTYAEMCLYDNLDDRFDYLELGGEVGEATFGNERWANQLFYRSREWKQIRDVVIDRDNGCEMGLPDLPIRGIPRIHHMNPLTMYDIEEGTDNLLNPEGLVAVSLQVHNAIHFGDRSQLPRPSFVERQPGDTIPWKPLTGRILL